jgi:hypothetical protein
MDSIKIGKIVQIEGLKLVIHITEDVSSKLTLHNDISDYVVSINKLVCSKLPSGKLAISKITKIYDKSLCKSEFPQTFEGVYLVEANLIGIYDRALERFDSGINTFPIIGTEVFAINKNIYNKVLEINSKYKLHIGNSYHDLDIKVYANPDVLFGKHLAVIGNTGTGKSCTIASIIQGIKRRLQSEVSDIKTLPKILIFDSNNEYKRAFPEGEFKVKHISKDNLQLPHCYLSMFEYYKFVGASQGVQAPVLKKAIRNLMGTSRTFAFSALLPEIEKVVVENARSNDFSLNQWRGYISTMRNRIERLMEDERFNIITGCKQDNIMALLEDEENEIFIFETDFDRDVLDVVMFLFCKIIYKWSYEKHRQGQENKNILLILEEAHQYINEQENDEYKLGTYYIERLAREGRKFDISLVISSQRPSELSKTVLSQCNSYIIHRINNKADLEFINRLLTISDRELLNIISGIEKQYAVVTGEAFSYSELVKIVTTDPTPKSDDPKVIDNWRERE